MKRLTFFLLTFFIGRLSAQRLEIATQMEKSITRELLDKYYPANLDTVYGGYITTYTYDFKPTGEQDKMIVTQARYLWTTSKAWMAYPKREYFRRCARHGFVFLRDVMWDKKNGGFFNLVDRHGNVKVNRNSPKEAYGNAFAIYGLAAYYRASRDTSALALAKKAFAWLEELSHDPIHKGYFQHLELDGTPMKSTADNPEGNYKDQNSSIHLLEAFTELYSVWKDDLLKARLSEMLYLIRDKMVSPTGYLRLFFTPDWKPVSYRDSTETFIRQNKMLDQVSFGHDVETAYLMLEASHILGLQHDERTLTIGKKMVDHALRYGWDSKLGGFYDEGYYFKDKPGMTILLNTKNWWAQAEGLNSLLLMADLFPGDSLAYFKKFMQLWHYTDTYLIDHEHGDWYAGGLDHEPHQKTALKAHIWKATYHNYRALENCIKRLKSASAVRHLP